MPYVNVICEDGNDSLLDQTVRAMQGEGMLHWGQEDAVDLRAYLTDACATSCCVLIMAVQASNRPSSKKKTAAVAAAQKSEEGCCTVM